MNASSISRRTMLRVGGMGMLGLTLPRLMAAEERPLELVARAKRVIFLFMNGAPSHVDV